MNTCNSCGDYVYDKESDYNGGVHTLCYERKKYLEERPKTQWFTTSKSLPDGWWMWRIDAEDDEPECHRVMNDIVWTIDGKPNMNHKDFPKGQWAGPIKFPG